MVTVTGISRFFNDITEEKNICLVMAFREKFMKKAPEILALRTLEQTSCKTIENPDKHWLQAWQHLATPKIAPK